MLELYHTLLEWVVYYRLELIGGAVLAALFFLRKRYATNMMVAAFIRFTQDQVVDAMEKAEVEDSIDAGKKHRKPSAVKKAAQRRKIRADLAKRARKANRGKGKGSKKAGGK
jgi:hypothetical protein